MNRSLLENREVWAPRSRAIIFADEDVDGICSAAIVGKRYDETKCEFVFVNARSLGIEMKKNIATINIDKENPDIDIFIVDVGINKANIKSIEQSVSLLVKKGARVYYFDSHSNKYKGKTLLFYLKRAKAHVFSGKIGSAAASIIQTFLGSESTKRLRLLGALSDREIRLTNRYKNEKTGLRSLQAAVAWGAWQNPEFLDKVTRKLMKNPNIDLESDKDILEYAIKANNHRDNLLRHVFRKGQVLQISETPRILAVTVLDRDDFGKARGTIAGRLAGEWGAAIILVTQSVMDRDSYAVTVRNSYTHKLDLEILGQLSKTKNSGGSKGAYRLTINKDNLMIFLSKVQAWSRTQPPKWIQRTLPTNISDFTPHRHRKQNQLQSNIPTKNFKPRYKEVKKEEEIIEDKNTFDEDIIDLSDLD